MFLSPCATLKLAVSNRYLQSQTIQNAFLKFLTSRGTNHIVRFLRGVSMARLDRSHLLYCCRGDRLHGFLPCRSVCYIWIRHGTLMNRKIRGSLVLPILLMARKLISEIRKQVFQLLCKINTIIKGTFLLFIRFINTKIKVCVNGNILLSFKSSVL